MLKLLLYIMYQNFYYISCVRTYVLEVIYYVSEVMLYTMCQNTCVLA